MSDSPTPPDFNSIFNSILHAVAPAFEVVEEMAEEQGVQVTPQQYLEACRENGKRPDIHASYLKIFEGTATIEDVEVLLEDAVEAVADRIQRRVRRTPSAGHITHGGHQRLGGPNVSGRVTPKRRRSGHTQSHGRGKHAHDKSTDEQQRNADSQ